MPFTMKVRAMDNPEGLEALNTNLLPSLSKHMDGSGYYVHGTYRPSNGSIRNSAPSVPSRLSTVTEANGRTSRSSTPTPSPGTNGHLASSTSSSLLSISASSKKRVSTLGPSSGRLAKLVGDLYLLSGKLSDASYW